MARDTRLQKFMAEAGIASRRKSEEYIQKGKVKVNGRVAQIGDKVDPKKDLVVVDGKEISVSNKKYYVMVNKPRGYVTTMSDEFERKCVAQLVSDIPARLYPIGRLDKDSEGLLFMTNDGSFANTVSHPSGHVSKLYRVTVRPAAKEDQITQMAIGVEIDGKKTEPCNIRVTTEEKERTVLEIVLNEGRNRQIRKMCEAVGLEVARLKRVAIGPVKLGMVQPGEYRDLTPDEIRRIRVASEKTKGGKAKDDTNTTNGRKTQRTRAASKPRSRRK